MENVRSTRETGRFWRFVAFLQLQNQQAKNFRRKRSDRPVRASHNTMAHLKAGESGKVESLGCTSRCRLRLMEMGLTPGTEITVTRHAAFGGPLDVRVRGYQLSLRREEAEAVVMAAEE